MTAAHDQHEKPSLVSTGILLLGAVYCLFPVLWVILASTKSGAELFSTFTRRVAISWTISPS